MISEKLKSSDFEYNLALNFLNASNLYAHFPYNLFRAGSAADPSLSVAARAIVGHWIVRTAISIPKSFGVGHIVMHSRLEIRKKFNSGKAALFASKT